MHVNHNHGELRLSMGQRVVDMKTPFSSVLCPIIFFFYLDELSIYKLLFEINLY